mmetsp:Transcript_23214/g.54923  ORF Transcript_23214/g.54923 Transcript_23214/m.54923 type:complete len:319 (-) Transcript_23214:703-1659(-)
MHHGQLRLGRAIAAVAQHLLHHPVRGLIERVQPVVAAVGVDAVGGRVGQVAHQIVHCGQRQGRVARALAAPGRWLADPVRRQARRRAKHLRVFAQRVQRDQPAHAGADDGRALRAGHGGVAPVDHGLELLDDEAQVVVRAHPAEAGLLGVFAPRGLVRQRQEPLRLVLGKTRLARVPDADDEGVRNAAGPHQPGDGAVHVPGLLRPVEAAVEQVLAVVHIEHVVAARGRVALGQPDVDMPGCQPTAGQVRQPLDAAHIDRRQARPRGIGGQHRHDQRAPQQQAQPAALLPVHHGAPVTAARAASKQSLAIRHSRSASL